MPHLSTPRRCHFPAAICTLRPLPCGAPRWAGAALLATTALLAGCQGAIQGRWHLEEAIPNKQTFALDNVSFNRDGTYSATLTNDGVTRQETGEYEFNGFNIRLRPKGGGQHKYTAQLGPGRLMLLNGSKKAVLRSGARGV